MKLNKDEEQQSISSFVKRKLEDGTKLIDTESLAKEWLDQYANHSKNKETSYYNAYHSIPKYVEYWEERINDENFNLTAKRKAEELLRKNRYQTLVLFDRLQPKEYEMICEWFEKGKDMPEYLKGIIQYKPSLQEQTKKLLEQDPKIWAEKGKGLLNYLIKTISICLKILLGKTAMFINKPTKDSTKTEKITHNYAKVFEKYKSKVVVKMQNLLKHNSNRKQKLVMPERNYLKELTKLKALALEKIKNALTRDFNNKQTLKKLEHKYIKELAKLKTFDLEKMKNRFAKNSNMPEKNKVIRQESWEPERKDSLTISERAEKIFGKNLKQTLSNSENIIFYLFLAFFFMMLMIINL